MEYKNQKKSLNDVYDPTVNDLVNNSKDHGPRSFRPE